MESSTKEEVNTNYTHSSTPKTEISIVEHTRFSQNLTICISGQQIMKLQIKTTDYSTVIAQYIILRMKNPKLSHFTFKKKPYLALYDKTMPIIKILSYYKRGLRVVQTLNICSNKYSYIFFIDFFENQRSLFIVSSHSLIVARLFNKKNKIMKSFKNPISQVLYSPKFSLLFLLSGSEAGDLYPEDTKEKRGNYVITIYVQRRKNEWVVQSKIPISYGWKSWKFSEDTQQLEIDSERKVCTYEDDLYMTAQGYFDGCREIWSIEGEKPTLINREKVKRGSYFHGRNGLERFE
jgi:hypothetical protein